MRILILGGTGYLGSKLVSSLISAKNDVICLRRRESDCSRVASIQSDIVYCEIEELEQFLSSYPEKIDWVVNTACHYCTGEGDDEKVIEANFLVPFQIFRICLRYGIRRYLTIDTGLPENFNIYSKTKSEFAEFGKYYSNKLLGTENNIEFCNILLENFYGEDEPLNRFLPSAIEKMKKDEPVLLTEGTQHRDFVYIDDVVNNLHNILSRKFTEGYWGIPLGSGTAPTIREVVQYLREQLHSHSILEFGAVPMRKNEPDSVADPAIMKQYGIEIKYQWRDGLKKLIEEKR